MVASRDSRLNGRADGEDRRGDKDAALPPDLIRDKCARECSSASANREQRGDERAVGRIEAVSLAVVHATEGTSYTVGVAVAEHREPV